MTSTSIRIDSTTLDRLNEIKNGRTCDQTLNDLLDFHDNFMADMVIMRN